MALVRLQQGGLEGTKCLFLIVSITFSGSPFILRFGPMLSCFLRVLRSVKLNDDSRDLSVSHSHTCSLLNMQFLRGTSWLHTPTKRVQYFRCFQFSDVSFGKMNDLKPSMSAPESCTSPKCTFYIGHALFWAFSV